MICNYECKIYLEFFAKIASGNPILYFKNKAIEILHNPVLFNYIHLNIVIKKSLLETTL